VERVGSGGGFEDVAGYCRAVRVDGLICVSGTAAPVADGERLADLDSYSQARRALDAALDYAGRLGGTHSRVVRTRMFLAPDAAWQDCARAHGEIFSAQRPANTTLYVARLIPEGALIEVELDAWVGDEDADDRR
jgi:enamine deaminase RidA (YjgF/YER057c/UK114 family)